MLALSRKEFPPDFGSACDLGYLASGSLVRSWKISSRARGYGIDRRRLQQQLSLSKRGFDQHDECVKTHTNR
jgi:hypothetical protein